MSQHGETHFKNLAVNPLFNRSFYLRGPKAKNSPIFLWHNFDDFMEKMF